MAVHQNGTEIVLSGMVGGSASGDGFWAEDGFSASDVIMALAEVGRENPVTIRLNSGGGIATEGSAIHSALMQHKGAVQIIVEGIAASAASVVACAADTLTIMPGAVFMIHDPAGVTFGTAADHRKAIAALDTLGTAYAGVYADRTGKSVEEMRAMMTEETWMTAEEAVSMGFADALASANDNVDEPMVAAFAYQTYARAPKQLVAMAQAKGWKPRAALIAAPAADPAKETIMADESTAGDAPAVEETPAVEIVDRVDADGVPVGPDHIQNLLEIAAICGTECGMDAAQAQAFILKTGGSLEAAKARAAEVVQIKADIEKAKRINPNVAYPLTEAIARGLSADAVAKELLEALATVQVAISPQAPAPKDQPKPEDPMLAAVAAINAARAKR